MTDNIKDLIPHFKSSQTKITLNLQEVLPPSPKPIAKAKPMIQKHIPKKVIPKKTVLKKPLKTEPIIKTPTIKTSKIKKTKALKKEMPQKKPIVKKESKKVLAQKSQKENNSTKLQVKKVQATVKKVIKPKVKPKKEKPKPVKKEVVKETLDLDIKIMDNSLGNILGGFGTSMYMEKSQASSNPQSQKQKKINKLYGSEFESYSDTQKEYIEHNLDKIQHITQDTLLRNGYPETAKQTKQLGTNTVSFYLHPNGDISDLVLKHPIGYESLDQNTLQVIRIAYKDYPLPNEKTRLIFYVEYLPY
jgi:TonB family protein